MLFADGACTFCVLRHPSGTVSGCRKTEGAFGGAVVFSLHAQGHPFCFHLCDSFLVCFESFAQENEFFSSFVFLVESVQVGHFSLGLDFFLCGGCGCDGHGSYCQAMLVGGFLPASFSRDDGPSLILFFLFSFLVFFFLFFSFVLFHPSIHLFQEHFTVGSLLAMFHHPGWLVVRFVRVSLPFLPPFVPAPV